MVNQASLDDYTPPEWKNKRSAERAALTQPSRSAPPMTAGMVVLEIATMNRAGVALGALMAWFLIVAARHGALN